VSLWNSVAIMAFSPQEDSMEKPTQQQVDDLKWLSKLARVPDESEIVTSKEEADIRIRDLKDKARME
jgi:hypothetical protein